MRNQNMHHLPRFALVSALGALLAACAPLAAPIAGGAMHDEILASMNQSGKEWTHGNLPAFMDSLAPGVANVIAFYVLSRGDSVIARGPTTVVMVRTPTSWKIVHDHSS